MNITPDDRLLRWFFIALAVGVAGLFVYVLIPDYSACSPEVGYWRSCEALRKALAGRYIALATPIVIGLVAVAVLLIVAAIRNRRP